MKFQRNSSSNQKQNLTNLRLLYIIAVGIMFTIIGFLIMFIHRYVYQTLELANAIVILRSEIGIELIDFSTLSKVQDAWKQKITTSSLDIRDPFVQYIPPAEAIPVLQASSTPAESFPTTTSTTSSL